MKKRILSVFLAVFMLLAGAAVPGNASSPVSITAPHFEIVAGNKTVTFPVILSDLPDSGLTSCRFNVRVGDALFTDAKLSDSLGGFLDVGPLDESPRNGVDLFWYNESSPIFSDVTVVTYTVELPESAVGGDVLPIVVTPSGDTDDFLDRNGNGITAVGINGSVTILCNHTIEYQPYRSASCEGDGHTAHKKCTLCGKLFADVPGIVPITKAEITVPAYGHLWQSWTTIKNASCTEPGLRQRVCLNDPVHTETQTIPAEGHTLVHEDAVSPTQKSEGLLEHWRCEQCGRCFADMSALTELDPGELTVERIHCGDVNRDGKVNARDVTAIMRMILGVGVDVSPEDADVNADGKVNARDVTDVMRRILSAGT